MREIITAQDIEERAGAGIREIVVHDQLTVTAMAREAGEKHGIRFVESVARAGLKPLDLVPSPPGQEADLLLLNARLVSPGQGIFPGGIAIKNGVIAAVGAVDAWTGRRTIQTGGRYLMPGIIDPHVHLGLFAPPETEYPSELQAGLTGGITTTGIFLGGPGSRLDQLEKMAALTAASTETDVFFHATILNQMQLEEIPACYRRGVRSFKFYLHGIPGLIEEVSDEFLLTAFSILAGLPGTLAVIHAENAGAMKWGRNRALQTGIRSLADWSQAHPAWGEAEAVERAALFARKTGVPVYFVHISSREGAAAVRRVKQADSRVFAETTSPYLALHDGDTDLGVYGKMAPPIRSRSDQDALWQACAAGTLDTIGTDHVAMTCREKQIEQGMAGAIPGYPALETHLPALLDMGIRQRGFDLVSLVEMMTARPAKIYGLYPRKGTLLPGSDADLVLADLQLERLVTANRLQSRCDFSPYGGKRLTGWPVLTIKGGQVVAEDGCYLGTGSGGTCLNNSMGGTTS